MANIFTAPTNTAQQMADSLPQGKAWGSKNIDDSNVRKLINALSVAPNRAQQQIELLASEFNINNTVALLPDWETSVGEPDSCSSGTVGTLAERREVVIEKLSKNPTVTLAEMQAYIDKKAPDNIVRLCPANTFKPEYESTVGNSLAITVGTDAVYPNTVANNLTRTTNPMPHYIAETVGNDATLSSDKWLQNADRTFSNGDTGKTIRFINANGLIVGTGECIEYDSSDGLRLSDRTGIVDLGVTLGGLWGFSTEPVVDDGDYIMTAGAAYFASSAVIGDTIKTIDANGDTVNTFEIMSWTSTTVVGVNLLTGVLVDTVYTGGTWDYSTEAITPASAYELNSSGSYFLVGNIGDTIKIIDVAGDELARLLITAFTSDTQVTVTLSSGAVSDGTIAGGLWGWLTETIANAYLSNPMFIIVAHVVGMGEQFEYDFEMTFENGINIDRINCLMNKIMPSNVILLIELVSE